MPVNLKLAPAVPVSGVELATLCAGLKSDGSADMVMVRLAEGSSCAAVFTSNTFCAAPVTLCRQSMKDNAGAVRVLLINSGNANAGTGIKGLAMASGHCQAVAEALAIPQASVLPFSTGVIGQLLPDEIMRRGISSAAEQLMESGTSGGDDTENSCTSINAWQLAARGIMTTDTVPKLSSQTVTVAGSTITLTGMAKGSGMIQPDMATMLSYVFTDAQIEPTVLDAALREAVAESFNAITVDSDTSTNDACVLCATGAAGVVLTPDASGWQAFMAALKKLCIDLATAIVRDAEGATKFISVHVKGGGDAPECRKVAYAIANSPLVKTAMFASDANVGRLLMAIGKADIADLKASEVRVSLGDVLAFSEGGIAPGYTEELGAEIMARDEIEVRVDLGRGHSQCCVYTSDLSHDYVSINADYRS